MAWAWLLLASCAIRGESARLVLVVDTDIAELDIVTFDVEAPDGSRDTAAQRLSPGNPATHWIHKAGHQPRGVYEVVVVGWSDGRAVVARQALLTVVDGESRAVTLHLVRACVGVVCPSDLVCSERGCRRRFVAQSELLAWDGTPPRLAPNEPSLVDAGGLTDPEAGLANAKDAEREPPPDASSHPVDAALDGSTESDASAEPAPSDANTGPAVPPVDAAAPSADPAACAASRCEGDRFLPCVNGRVGSAEPCGGNSGCSRGSCRPESGCVAVPVPDGTSCGSGLICRAGVCGAATECEGDCSPSCGVNTGRCELDCGASGANCKPSCGAGSTCDVRCDDTSNCDVQCAGSCNVTCSGVSNCEVRCAPGSDCQIDCRSVEGNCKKIRCERGASCLLRCGESDDCEFERCEASEMRCANGDLVCQRACPP